MAALAAADQAKRNEKYRQQQQRLLDAIAKLKKNDIQFLRRMPRPTPPIKTTLEVVCLLLGYEPHLCDECRFDL